MAIAQADRWASRWKTGMDGCGPSYEYGIRSKVLEAPGPKAAVMQAKMRANVLAAIDTGMWASRVSEMSLQEWQQKAINKGVPRITSSAAESLPKYRKYVSAARPVYESLQAQVKSMPKMTSSDGDQRMLTWKHGMEQFGRQFKGSGEGIGIPRFAQMQG